jgi:hypothetical protein
VLSARAKRVICAWAVSAQATLIAASPLSAAALGKRERRPLPEWATEITYHGKRVPVAKGRILVKFRKSFPRSERAAKLAEFGLKEKRYYDFIDVYLVTVTGGRSLEKALETLENRPFIQCAEPDSVGQPALYSIPNDPFYQSNSQYNLVNTQVDRAWNDTNIVASMGSTSMIVSVVDSGIRYTHEDFYIYSATIAVDSRVLTSPTGPGPWLLNGHIVGIDCTTDPISYNPWDCLYHGTGVASILGSGVDNSVGIAGTTWLPKILPVKIMDCSGNFAASSTLDGIAFSRSNGASVINMSWDIAGPSAALYYALSFMSTNGVVLVGVAGNEAGAIIAPASYPFVIGVGSVNKSEQWSTFSNYGFGLDVMAPGEGIFAANYPSDSAYAAGTGTSASAPQVAGLAALLLSQNPDWPPETAYRRIIRTTDKPPPPFSETYDSDGWNQHMGYGRINVYQALGGLESTTYYAASVYLYNSVTTVSNPSGTNPVARHKFADSAGGNATFTCQQGDPNGVVVTKAEAKITNPDLSITTVSLTPAVSGTLATYSGGIAVPGTFDFSSSGLTYVPDVVLSHTHTGTTKIPLPAYVLPSPVPASITVTVSPPTVDAGGTASLGIVVKDSGGNALTNACSGYPRILPGPGCVIVIRLGPDNHLFPKRYSLLRYRQSPAGILHYCRWI